MRRIGFPRGAAGNFLKIGLCLWTVAAPGWALTPMDYYQSLVAGGGEPGFRDGGFAVARFREPLGLAFDGPGRKLYVADSGNHRIRVVDLDRNNRVETLAGGDAAGSLDGPLSKATFDAPERVVLLPGRRLAVFDAGSRSIRVVDLRNRRVSTLAREVSLRDMVYRPQDDSLYFSEPDGKEVERLDLKTSFRTSVFSDNPLVPAPGALCLYQGDLCVADAFLPTIYRVIPAAAASVSLSPVGKAKDVLALSSSDGLLYALLKGGVLVRAGLPQSDVVRFPTPWGFLFKNTDYPGMPLFRLPADRAPGFSASPAEPRRLFISAAHSIISVSDYDFEQRWGAIEKNRGALTDFDYPVPKPAGTFRILAIGPSRNSTSVPLPAHPGRALDETIQSPKVDTFPKQLEFLLNTEATLRNSRIHFQVLNFTRRGDPVASFAYADVPALVKRYDIDLVLGMAGESGYKDYYEKPMTPEGIPSDTMDYEYLLQPLSDRARTGVAVNLIQRCRALKFPISEKQDCPGDGLFSLFCSGDRQMRDDLMEMAGQRLQLLDKKLGTLETSEGTHPRLVIYYLPCSTFPNDCLAPFWRDVCDKNHLTFLDLTEPYDALKASYYPTNVVHYTVYGNGLIALLLSHYLTEKGFLPF